MGVGGRVAVVTGAGRGIGRQVALTLASEGCHVLACSRTESDLRAIADAANGPGRIVPFPIDIASDGAAGEIVAAAVEEFGRLDIAVNNAGGFVPRRLDRMTPDRWREAFAVDFFGAAALSVAAVEPMRGAGWGRIVNVASTYGREPDPSFAAYGAAKAALINLTKSFARAYAAEGVQSNCVIPGVTRTEGVDERAGAAAERAGVTVDDVLAETMAKDPVAAGRFGQPAEVADAIVFLASERASWISGACLAVDGSTLRVAP